MQDLPARPQRRRGPTAGPAPHPPPPRPTPILDSNAADPWIVHHRDRFYLTCTGGSFVPIRCSANIRDFRDAQSAVVWRPAPGSPWSIDVWAPELHLVRGAWYVYVTCAMPHPDRPDGRPDEPTRRTCVLRCNGSDPMVTADWVFLGPVKHAPDHWGIDATLFSPPSDPDSLYRVWSGWQLGDYSDRQQDLFVVRLRSPEEAVPGTYACIARAELSWERTDDNSRGILEGPTFVALADGSWQGIVYSGNASWLSDYSLGLLELVDDRNVCSPASWRKRAHPLLVADPDLRLPPFGPGHASFVRSGDGRTVYCVHHAMDGPRDGWATRKGYVLPIPFAAFRRHARPICCATGREIHGEFRRTVEEVLEECVTLEGGGQDD